MRWSWLLLLFSLSCAQEIEKYNNCEYYDPDWEFPIYQEDHSIQCIDSCFDDSNEDEIKAEMEYEDLHWDIKKWVEYERKEQKRKYEERLKRGWSDKEKRDFKNLMDKLIDIKLKKEREQLNKNNQVNSQQKIETSQLKVKFDERSLQERLQRVGSGEFKLSSKLRKIGDEERLLLLRLVRNNK